MSERINVDHAFDPEARQAQAELDAYMNTRPFKDDNDKVHNPDNGQFANYDNLLDAKRDTHYDQTLEENDYSSESLEDLAKRVAQARSEGDKTRANDAEEAFFSKFAEYSEKYGWEDEDGSDNESARVDKDAPLGRATVDHRLERYSKIMYGEVGPTEQAPGTGSENTPTPSSNIETEVTEHIPRHAAEYTDEDSPVYNSMQDEAAQTGAEAKEGESLEEYESRQDANGGRHRLERASTDGLDVTDTPSGNPLEKASIEGLDVVDTPATEAAREADAEQATKTKLSWRDRLRRLASPAGLAAELSAGMHSTKEKLGNHKKAALGLGILAVAGSVAAIYLTRDSGGSGGSGTNGGGLKDLLTPPTGPKDPNATKELLDSSAWNIPKGSGGEALMERLGADKSTWYQHQNEFLNQFPGEAYRMPDGNVGFDDPGRLSKGAIKFWAKYASK